MDRDNFRGWLVGLFAGAGAVAAFGDDISILMIAGLEEVVHHPLSDKVAKAITGIVGVLVTGGVQALTTHYTKRDQWTPAERAVEVAKQKDAQI